MCSFFILRDVNAANRYRGAAFEQTCTAFSHQPHIVSPFSSKPLDRRDSSAAPGGPATSAVSIRERVIHDRVGTPLDCTVVPPSTRRPIALDRPTDRPDRRPIAPSTPGSPHSRRDGDLWTEAFGSRSDRAVSRAGAERWCTGSAVCDTLLYAS